MNLEEHLKRQIAFSTATFGPGPRTEGVTDHIQKELVDAAAAEPGFARAKEWTDVAILALDGLTRELVSSGLDPEQAATVAVEMILEKQDINEKRTWPDWRTQPLDKAIEHVRTAA